jgi:hypothetical protein
MTQPWYNDPTVIYDALSGRFFASMLIFDRCDGCAGRNNSESTSRSATASSPLTGACMS